MVGGPSVSTTTAKVTSSVPPNTLGGVAPEIEMPVTSPNGVMLLSVFGVKNAFHTLTSRD